MRENPGNRAVADGPLRRRTLRLVWPILAAVLALALQLSGLLTSGERLLRDAMLRRLPPRAATHAAAVLVDEAALRRIGPWPWDRARLGNLIRAVRAAGARGVAVDLLLPEARPGDRSLASALAAGPSVLAVGVDDSGHWLWPEATLRKTGLAHVSFDLDRDGVVRRFSATREIQGRELAAFPVAAARLADPRLPIPVGRVLRPGFRARTIPRLSASDLLEGPAPGDLRGRVVFLGVSAAGLGDRVVTPVSPRGRPEPGVLVEAQAAEAILAGDLLRPAPPLLGALLAFGLAWLTGRLLEAPRRRLRGLVPLVLLAPLPLAMLALASFRLILAPLAGVVALGAAAGGMAWDHARRSRREAAGARRRISELEALQTELSEARAQEAEARRVVAHELKTPLTSVRGLAQLLAGFDLSEAERARVAGMVASEAARLSGMVDALLDLERLRLRDFAREARLLDLSALCRERAEVLRTGGDRPFEVEVDPGLRVLGDPALLARMVENLVSNAIKFSGVGAPVRIALEAEGPTARLAVEDRGPGIPEDERARIFGRFARGSAQALAPGLGLGLALVAEGAVWHRGTVEVKAGREGGSRFEVRLPLAPAD